MLFAREYERHSATRGVSIARRALSRSNISPFQWYAEVAWHFPSY